jgi:hypothetical protein
MLNVSVMTEATFMPDVSDMFDFSAPMNVPLMFYVAFMFMIMFVNDDFWFMMLVMWDDNFDMVAARN